MCMILACVWREEAQEVPSMGTSIPGELAKVSEHILQPVLISSLLFPSQ